MAAQINAALLILALFLFVWWFYGPWQKLCVDWGRQQIFEARNAIFDLAADGRLSFESREYRIIRSDLEALIRFSHRISWTRLAIYQILDRPRVGESQIADAIDEIVDPTVRKEVERQFIKAVKGAIWIMVSRSLIGLVMYGMMRVVTTAYKPARQTARDTRQTVYWYVQEDATRYEGNSRFQRRAA